MKESDDDLRTAFQRWRTQEAEAAPCFPGIPERSRRQPAKRAVWLLPASLGAAAAGLVLLLLGFPHPAEQTLAEALPHPLLSPAEGKTSFLAGLTPKNAGFTSDFLQPTRGNSPDRLF